MWSARDEQEKAKLVRPYRRDSARSSPAAEPVSVSDPGAKPLLPGQPRERPRRPPPPAAVPGAVPGPPRPCGAAPAGSEPRHRQRAAVQRSGARSRQRIPPSIPPFLPPSFPPSILPPSPGSAIAPRAETRVPGEGAAGGAATAAICTVSVGLRTVEAAVTHSRFVPAEPACTQPAPPPQRLLCQVFQVRIGPLLLFNPLLATAWSALPNTPLAVKKRKAMCHLINEGPSYQ